MIAASITGGAAGGGSGFVFPGGTGRVVATGVLVGDITGVDSFVVLSLIGPVGCVASNVRFPAGLVTRVCVCVLLLVNAGVVWTFKPLLVEPEPEDEETFVLLNESTSTVAALFCGLAPRMVGEGKDLGAAN